LSQYIGLFHPLAHVKGSFGLNFTAPTCNNFSATAFSIGHICTIIVAKLMAKT
jgi:Mg2+ and Co2+ transporter CorA